MNKIKQFFVSIGLWFKNAGIAIGKWFASWFVSIDDKRPKFVSIGLWFKAVGIAIGKWFASWFVTIDGKRAKFVSIGRWFASWFVSIDGKRAKFVSIGRWFKSWFVSVDDKRPKFVSIGLWFKNWFVPVDGKPNHFIKIGRWFKGLFVSVGGKKPGFVTLYQKDSTKSIISSLMCIACGILIGFVILIIVALASGMSFGNVTRGIIVLLGGPFFTGSVVNITFGFNGELLSSMFLRATPILMTGLSVAIAFKTGLFNIGAPGQYLMGTMTSLIVALSIPNESGNNGFWIWLLAIVAGFVAGMVWGAIPGLFKAILNVNEVIVCIMTNWSAATIVSWVFSNSPYINTTSGKSGFIVPTETNNVFNPKFGMDVLLGDSWADGGIIIGIIVAVLIFVLLNKTVKGYELKACGHNRNASKYAGMNEKRNIILSMALAGGLAALGGALYFLNGKTEFAWETSTTLPAEGFNGIPVALLASNNPIGVIFSAIFLSYLDIGGTKLASVTSFNEYIADLIVAIIIYFAAFSKLFRDLLNRKRKKSNSNTNADSQQGKESTQSETPTVADSVQSDTQQLSTTKEVE